MPSTTEKIKDESGVSVIICCYNSAKRLPATLKHLAAQQLDSPIDWEIIVVDNSSTDGTAAVARDEWAKYNREDAAFKIIEEQKPGKNEALKKGVLEARYGYIITCDDDNWLSPNYIASAFTYMQANVNVGASGGHGLFEPEHPVAKEIEGFEDSYVNGPQPWAANEHWVYGAGCVYRKSGILPLFNGTWPLIATGRVGGKLNGGEDAEMCFMLYLRGYQITYNDKLIFKHFVPLTRQRLSYILELKYWQSYSNVLLNSYYSVFNQTENISKMLDRWYLSSAKTYIKTIAGQIIRLGKKGSTEEQIRLKKTYGTFFSLRKNRKKIVRHHNHIKQLLSELKAEQPNL